MKLRMKLIGGVLLVSFVLFLGAPGVRAQGAPDTPPPPGTIITLQNWQQYKQFMPGGMQALFAGKYHWKFPADFQMVIGPPTNYQQPKVFVDDTEKYAPQVKIVTLPNGMHTLSGYVAGLPFPNPQEPMKGWKVLVNLWYRYQPWVCCGPVTRIKLIDRFGNITRSSTNFDYIRVGHVAAAGLPFYSPVLPDVDYCTHNMLTIPEQSKYTTNMTLYYLDATKFEDVFIFVPALRRVLRLSPAARCSPFIGTDLTQDDNRAGWNGGYARFDGKFVRDQIIPMLINADPLVYSKVENYYPGLLFPRPIIGKWEMRKVDVIDVRRIPQQRAGYCYGKRIMYVDKVSFSGTWVDSYDSSMRLWKINWPQHIARNVPGLGMLYETLNFIYGTYDVQNAHATVAWTSDSKGHDHHGGDECKDYLGVDYADVARFCTPGGLRQVMR